MKVDRSHKGWLIFLGIATAGGGAVYALSPPPNGPWGNTWTGLTFGVLVLLMILFAGALGVRKKVLLLRVGRVQTWTKGHLWVGALSLPFMLYHGAFQWGGPLTTVLFILLILVVLSGILGAALQHTLPTVMMSDLPNEATYEHIERSLVDLRCEAYEHVWAACGEPPNPEEARKIAAWRRRDANQRRPAHRPAPAPMSAETVAAGNEAAPAQMLAADLGPKEPKPSEFKKAGEVPRTVLKRFYNSVLRDYLRTPWRRGGLLKRREPEARVFEAVRTELEPSLHETLDDLAAVCSDARQIGRQARLHRWLHGWQFMHVPLAMALLVLALVHAVMALQK